MRIYRLESLSTQMGSEGFLFFTSMVAAPKKASQLRRIAKDYEIIIDTLEFKPTLKGILGLLWRVASHPNNG